MITFTDGSTMTYKEVAALIRAERRLGTRHFNNAGVRCATGVINDTQPDGLSHHRVKSFDPPIGFDIIYTNDGFRGSPEERAKYMARKFEAAPEIS